MLYIALLLLLAAIAVVLVEFFVPSAGILGILAFGLGVAAVIFGFRDSLEGGALILTLGVIAVPILLILWVKVWPHTPLGRRILLDDNSTDDVMPDDEHYQRTAALKGQLGVAATKMLPSGQVIIGGEKFDAVSEGFAIEAGDQVIVSSVRENRIYVEPFEGDAEDAQLPASERSLLNKPIEEFGLEE